jgi:hypothetical protein
MEICSPKSFKSGMVLTDTGDQVEGAPFSGCNTQRFDQAGLLKDTFRSEIDKRCASIAMPVQKLPEPVNVFIRPRYQCNGTSTRQECILQKVVESAWASSEAKARFEADSVVPKTDQKWSIVPAERSDSQMIVSSIIRTKY